MKVLSTLFCLSISAVAFACPEIAGKYICHSEGITSQIEVIKTNNIPTYKTIVKEEGETYESEFIVDGKERVTAEDEDDITYISKVKYECVDDVIKMTFIEDTSDNSYKANGTNLISLDGDNNIITEYKSSHVWDDGTSENDDYTEVCERVN